MNFLHFCLIFFSTSLHATESKDLQFSTPCNPNNQQVSISFVGDILIHKPLYLSVISGSKHFNQIWKNTEPLLQKADFSVGNLEGPAAMGIDRKGIDHGDVGFIYDDNVYSGTNLVFNFHPRILSDLKDSGFDLLTSANNHVMDRFSIGIDKTILAARAINLPTVGTRKMNEPNGEFFKIVQIKNMNVAFVGCTEFINDTDKNNQVLMCETDKLFNIIKVVSARSDVDALVVLTHWGVEYSNTPKDYQRDFARRYLDAGATAVVGSHPHVLQPWEKYTTKDGRETLIIYSLGNFVAYQSGLEKQTGAITYLGLSKTGNEKAKIFGVAYTPTYRSNSQIIPVGKDGLKDVLTHASSMYGTRSRVEPSGSLNPTMCNSNIIDQ